MARPLDGPGPAGSGSLALMLNAEISAVITAMRANAKWAVVPGKYNVSPLRALCGPLGQRNPPRGTRRISTLPLGRGSARSKGWSEREKGGRDLACPLVLPHPTARPPLPVHRQTARRRT